MTLTGNRSFTSIRETAKPKRCRPEARSIAVNVARLPQLLGKAD